MLKNAKMLIIIKSILRLAMNVLNVMELSVFYCTTFCVFISYKITATQVF